MDKQNRAIIKTAIFICMLAAVGAAEAGGALGWFGNDSRNSAMGGGGQAIGEGPGNLLINPGLMSFCPGGIWLGFSAAPNLLRIRPKDRPAGFDVPEAVYQTDADDWADRPIPTNLLTNSRGPTEGLAATYLLNIAAIGSLGIRGFRAGLGATFPMPSLLDFKTWYNDEREQHFTNRLHFERFGEFDNLLTFYPALSYAPIEWLSLGMALKLDLAMGMGTGIYLPQGDQWEYAYIAPSGEVKPALRPIAALAFKTPFGLSVGLVYRYQSYMDIDLDVRIRIWSVEQGQEGPQNQFVQTHRYTVGFEPSEVALAAGYERGIFKMEVGSTWQHWSNYKDRHGNDWTHPAWNESAGQWKDPEFDNVFTVHGGIELWVAEPAALRAGLAYYPSPMPSQVGRYNYVDNDILLYSLGAGFRFDVFGRTVTADVAGQLWHMRELSVNKLLGAELSTQDGGLVDEVPDDMTNYETGEPLAGAEGLQTNNPGFPGYSLGGVAFNIALMIGMELN
jgi:long-chain fatty acid transport protein